MTLSQVFRLITFLSLFCFGNSYFETHLKASDHCFCKLKGRIDDCSCNVDTVDHFNNMKIYPRLRSLLSKDYFRFYRVYLKQKCPFWSDDSRCAMRYCHVEPCLDTDIPEGLKGHQSKNVVAGERASFKYSSEAQAVDCDHDHELGYLNTTISAATYEEFARWKAYDDAQDNFCVMNEEDKGAEYVDLLLNPERYTGYKGKSAHRIWNSIYLENCFRFPRRQVCNSDLSSGMYCLVK